jgi:hypothetical protein
MNSSTSNYLRTWLFRALTVEDMLDRLEGEGMALRAGTDPRALQRVIPLEDFSPAIRREAMNALAAYLSFFCLENSVRELVSGRMQAAFGSAWWDSHTSAGIREKVAKRQASEGENRWHIARGAEPIFYTDFGDLKSIIQSNWPAFDDLFPDQNWLLARLSELEASRNIIAHMNALDERENARLALYLRDWVRQVG